MSNMDINRFRILNQTNNNTGAHSQKAPAKAEEGGFKLVNQILNQAQQNTSSIISNIKQNIIQQSDIKQTQIQLSQLDMSQKSVLVKDLMNLPSEFKDLVGMLYQNKSNAQKNSVSSFLDFSKLFDLLSLNGKNARQNIFMLIGQMETAKINSSQMKELSYIVNACIPGTSTSETQVLKNIILLYLPWLPIGQENNFDVSISSKDEQKADEENSLTLTIQTVNYGVVKVILYLNKGNKVDISVSCSKEFPKKELKEMIEQEAKNSNIITGMDFTEIKNIKENTVTQAKINLNVSTNINPFLVLMAHSAIKCVIQLDKNATLINGRQEMI